MIMNKIIAVSLCLFFNVSTLFAGDFNDLFMDLKNYWTLAKRSVYLNDLITQGLPVFTNNSLDFYISGTGFFVVYDDVADILYLTRNGRFGYNFRGRIVNEDGYYVLNTQRTYINKIDLDKRNFQEDFLIAAPIDDNYISTSDKYILASDLQYLDNVRIVNKLLEAMPVSLHLLLDKAIPDIANNENYDKKAELMDLIYKRYEEIKELNLTSACYYDWLLEKIKNFEEKLFETPDALE